MIESLLNWQCSFKSLKSRIQVFKELLLQGLCSSKVCVLTDLMLLICERISYNRRESQIQVCVLTDLYSSLSRYSHSAFFGLHSRKSKLNEQLKTFLCNVL